MTTGKNKYYILHTSSLFNTGQQLDIWKHFAGIGGADKDRMVTIATWLLSFSAGIIWYMASHIESVHFNEGKLIIMAGLGIIVSGASCWIVLLYGSYAMWNWAKADSIALDRKWKILQPSSKFPSSSEESSKYDEGIQFSLIKRLGKPPSDRTQYAPIFKVFFVFTMGSLIIHILFLVYIYNPASCSRIINLLIP